MNLLPEPLGTGAGSRPLRAVLDTDTYNEIDDQFALVYALLAPECIELEAVHAAPFFYPALNSRSSSAADGMEKSHDEILRVLERTPCARRPQVHRGSDRFLGDRSRPVRSPAVTDLIRRARAMPEGDRLCVFSTGAITNVASALLLDPEIAARITVVWLGGNPHAWHDGVEFNLCQDVAAAQAVLESGVPFVQIPCRNVAEHLRTTVPEMAAYVRGRGAIGDYLYKIFEDYDNAGDRAGAPGWSKPLWDIACVAVAIIPRAFEFQAIPRPVLTSDMRWLPGSTASQMTVAVELKRNDIYGDLFARLERLASGAPSSGSPAQLSHKIHAA